MNPLRSQVGNKVRVLRDTLAWDRAHEFVLTDTGTHIRHVNRSFLCGDEVEGMQETTPWGGDGICSKCAKQVPSYVHWVEPPELDTILLSFRVACFRLGVTYIHVDEIPEEVSGGTPQAGLSVSPAQATLYIRAKMSDFLPKGVDYEALHELAHVLTAPYGFDSEVGCGHYAVQYALARHLYNSEYLKKRTLEMQGLGDPIFGGVLQARAWSLGLLSEDRGLPDGIKLSRTPVAF